MTTPFTYYVYHRPTGLKYYGVSYRKGCHPSDLWNKYFTSSKSVKKLIAEYGIDSFDVEVRRTFTEALKAREWECTVLRRLKVLGKPEWLNKTYNKSPSTKGYRYTPEQRAKMSVAQSGSKNPMFGKTHTPEARASIAAAGRSRRGNVPPEVRANLSRAAKKRGMSEATRKASMSSEAKERRRQSMLGQKRSPESRQRMREARLRYLASVRP